MSTPQFLDIALCSFDPLQKSPAENLKLIRQEAEIASQQGAQILILPEMTLSGFEMSQSQCPLDAQPGEPIYDSFSQIARQQNLFLIAGLVQSQLDNLPLNQLIVWDPSGQEIARYSKIHPFSLGEENRYFDSGKALAKASIGPLQAGLSICYDLRFGEIFRALSDCPLLINIACWPKRREAHWKLLCAARALENRCYFAGVNRTGTDSLGLHYSESSGIWDPNGEKVEPIFQKELLQIVRIDLNWVRKARLALPALRDRKPELYRNWL